MYRTVILPVVLYECETWSLTLREKHRSRVFEKKVIRRIFWLKRNEVIGDWRKLHNEELHNLYSLLRIITIIKLRKMRRVGHVACMVEKTRRKIYAEILHKLENLWKNIG
jgi:hypothetical protein